VKLETSRRCYRVDRSRISFVKFILEAYDNVAVLSTVDARRGMVQICIAPGCETLVDGIVAELSREFEMTVVDGAAGTVRIAKERCICDAGKEGSNLD
jgi:hypothetical protein